MIINKDFFIRQNPAYCPICYFYIRKLGNMKQIISFENENKSRKKSVLLKKIPQILCTLLVVVFICFIFLLLKNLYTKKAAVINQIEKAWSDYNYEKIYELGKPFLQENPYNNTVLTYYGYSCFFLAQSQINDNSLTQQYLDECINKLRLAMYDADKKLLPQLQYMLGRAYFSKSALTNNCYSDLAIKYLLLAKDNGYVSNDIPEYLGLSYAALGLTMESISAFSEALLNRESDALLLSIAEQYYIANELSAAEQYLFRIIKNSPNDEMILKSQILLGNIYVDREDYEKALKEFENVLEKYPNSADAHYGIGVIYEKQGNLVKARAEWRQTLKIQVNHQGALQKLNSN